MNATNYLKMFAAFGLVSSAAMGCAATTPVELKDARAAYRHAATGPAAERARTHLESAKRALARAEAEFQDDGDSADTRDLAYIAQRLAQLSEAEASLALAQSDRDQAKQQLALEETRLREAQEQALQAARGQSEEAKRLEAEARENARDAEMRAQAEHEGRTEAEQRAQRALERAGKVEEEARGTVVNISGAVLFTSGSAKILPAAEENLSALTDALKNMGDRHIVIEGHTDSTGSAAGNKKLSLRRAESVKAFLVRHGVPSKQIETVGLGADQPIADNSTEEGRASNRRVEVIIEREATS